MDSSKIKIFISYAREDCEAARQLYTELKQAQLDPWLDKLCLLPGQRWKTAINLAIRESHYFIALISSNSVGKRGFVQKELSAALEILDEFPESRIFLIPVRLNDCAVLHSQLGELQWVDLFPSWEEGVKKLLRVFEFSTEAGVKFEQEG